MINKFVLTFHHKHLDNNAMDTKNGKSIIGDVLLSLQMERLWRTETIIIEQGMAVTCNKFRRSAAPIFIQSSGYK